MKTIAQVICVVNAALVLETLAQQPGSLDPSFNPGSGVSKSGSAMVSAILIQPDGRILIAGDFTTVDGVSRPRVARLHGGGSLDASFDPGAGPDNEVLAMALQPDGKVLIGGAFTSVSGTARNRIARLHSNGSLDATFDPGTGADWEVNSLAAQADGKVLLGGSFGEVNGTPRPGLARLDGLGRLDAAFAPALGDGATVRVVVLHQDTLLVAGVFSGLDATVENRIARLSLAGTLDPSFHAAADDPVLALVPEPDGGLVMAGAFRRVQAAARNRVARLNPDGSLAPAFGPGAGPNGDVLAAVRQPNGSIVLGGNFDLYDALPKAGVARLHANGSLDTSFNTGPGLDGSVQSLAWQNDGKLLVGGFISTVDGVARNGIARLHGDAQVADVRLINPRWNSAGFAVSLATLPGKTYVLQFRNTLVDPWVSLPGIPGNGSILDLTDSPTPAPQRFYRVHVP